MASLSLVFDLLARDKASKEFKNVGDSAESTGERTKRMGVAVGVGLAAAGAAAFKFGKDSVGAYVEAQQSSARLDDALKRFPATNDVTRASFDQLNTALAAKTRFDDDATASGQAVLAQFKLTGTQIEQLTPLLQDYAAKTGKDVPEAAEVLGKALLGKGKALAEVGVKFKDAGSVQENYTQITEKLRAQVGGFAETEGKTAAGQAEILKNRFGEMEEAVGAKLLPILSSLAGFILGTVAPLFERIGSYLGSILSPAFDFLSKAIGVVKIAFGQGGTELNEFDGKLRTVNNAALRIREAFSAVVGFIRADVVPVFQQVAGFVTEKVVPALLSLYGVIWNSLRKAFDTINNAIGDNREQLAQIGHAVKVVAETLLAVLVPVLKTAIPIAFGILGKVITTTITVIGGIVRAIEAITDAVKTAVEWIGKMADKIKSLPSKIPGAGLLGKLPGFASGGTLPPGWSMTGEYGPELVYSPTGGQQVLSHADSQRLLAGRGGTGRDGVTIENLNVLAPTSSPQDIARSTVLALRMA